MTDKYESDLTRAMERTVNSSVIFS